MNLIPGLAYDEAAAILRASGDGGNGDDIEALLAPPRLRKAFVRTFGFSIITAEEVAMLTRMLAGKRLLEAGAGSGYISKLLSDQGAQVTASDSGGWARYGVPGAAPYQRDHDGDTMELPMQGFDAVLMSWPPLGAPFALQVASRMISGQILLYLGEGAGGCTADMDFFKEIGDGARWRRMDDASSALNHSHLRFDGMGDRWQVLERL